MVFVVVGIFFFVFVLGVIGSWLGYVIVIVMVFIGSLLIIFLVYWLVSSKGYIFVVMMLLVGVAIIVLGGVFIGLMIYFFDEDELCDIIFWILGSLGGANW